MSYSERLKDPKWQRRRLEIMGRDCFTCQKCGAKDKTLSVHHRYYIAARQPWDYPGNILVTLCEKCHQEEEQFKDGAGEFAKTLQYWGYFNTEIVKICNDLIEVKMKSNNLSIEPDAKSITQGLDKL